MFAVSFLDLLLASHLRKLSFQCAWSVLCVPYLTLYISLSILCTPFKVLMLWILHYVNFMRRKTFLLSLESGNISTCPSSTLAVWPIIDNLSCFLVQLTIIIRNNQSGFTLTSPRRHIVQQLQRRDQANGDLARVPGGNTPARHPYPNV
jgi:hypothetical protein